MKCCARTSLWRNNDVPCLFHPLLHLQSVSKRSWGRGRCNKHLKNFYGLCSFRLQRWQETRDGRFTIFFSILCTPRVHELFRRARKFSHANLRLHNEISGAENLVTIRKCGPVPLPDFPREVNRSGELSNAEF